MDICCGNKHKTSMHSSRMRTARLLAVSPSMHCAGGSAPGGVCSGGGGLLPGGVCSRGVCYPSMHSTCLEVSVFKWWLWKRSVSDTNVAKVIPGYPISQITTPPYPTSPDALPPGTLPPTSQKGPLSVQFLSFFLQFSAK